MTCSPLDKVHGHTEVAEVNFLKVLERKSNFKRWMDEVITKREDQRMYGLERCFILFLLLLLLLLQRLCHAPAHLGGKNAGDECAFPDHTPAGVHTLPLLSPSR